MSARVLFVEDHPINRELMEWLLRASGFEPLQAVDGRVGLDIAARERPDLILCDIQMPGMDGFEFARCIRADPQLRGTPLVAVTAFAMVGDRERIMAAGFDDYVAKPIDPHALAGTINALLGRARKESPPAPKPPSAQASPTSGQGAVILVLDDTPFNIELKVGLLAPHGYKVLTANAATQALQLAREHLPALIISDVGMREGSGFDFIRTVKADPRLRDIPFMFLTATHWNESSETLGLSLGAVRYLRRPIESAELLAEIQAVLRR